MMLEPYRKLNRAAFIPFIVAGDPSIEASERMIDALVEEGADLLELGVPFSDALADGPVIQAASERASRHTHSIMQVLDLAARVGAKHPQLPLILFTYYNPILRLGIERFAERAKAAGIAATLVVDLPPEEGEAFMRNMAQSGVSTVFLASPTTSPERIRRIAEASTGFVYYVSRTGVTGVQSDLSQSLETEIRALRAVTDKPVAVGFGISKPEHARAVARLGDAVVVGSAFVRLIADNPDLDAAEREVRQLARQLADATRTARD